MVRLYALANPRDKKKEGGKGNRNSEWWGGRFRVSGLSTTASGPLGHGGEENKKGGKHGAANPSKRTRAGTAGERRVVLGGGGGGVLEKKEWAASRITYDKAYGKTSGFQDKDGTSRSRRKGARGR